VYQIRAGTGVAIDKASLTRRYSRYPGDVECTSGRKCAPAVGPKSAQEAVPMKLAGDRKKEQVPHLVLSE